MFGPRLGTVFASRWRALWWAAAVLLTAYCTIPAPERDAGEQGATSPADDAAARAALERLEELRDQADEARP